MTLDEAVYKIRTSCQYDVLSAVHLAKALHALDLLKFDEPESIDWRIIEAMTSSLLFLGHEHSSPEVASAIIMNLKKRGFKIVEWIEPR